MNGYAFKFFVNRDSDQGHASFHGTNILQEIVERTQPPTIRPYTVKITTKNVARSKVYTTARRIPVAFWTTTAISFKPLTINSVFANRKSSKVLVEITVECSQPVSI